MAADEPDSSCRFYPSPRTADKGAAGLAVTQTVTLFDSAGRSDAGGGGWEVHEIFSPRWAINIVHICTETWSGCPVIFKCRLSCMTLSLHQVL